MIVANGGVGVGGGGDRDDGGEICWREVRIEGGGGGRGIRGGGGDGGSGNSEGGGADYKDGGGDGISEGGKVEIVKMVMVEVRL
ncbi:hypothetical protein Pmani_011068 [Petrolisthes manimaculis]|uniref:Uncharacterized protein n=1 Tax=Petrolisthes manimaculis TaxID=1843537 RepID=A0AAE1Q1V9_9EUCA|nr:hypothetical protein Pmani_011068 [Petrolisthes manimaculis]